MQSTIIILSILWWLCSYLFHFLSIRHCFNVKVISNNNNNNNAHSRNNPKAPFMNLTFSLDFHNLISYSEIKWKAQTQKCRKWLEQIEGKNGLISMDFGVSCTKWKYSCWQYGINLFDCRINCSLYDGVSKKEGHIHESHFYCKSSLCIFLLFDMLERADKK